MTNQFAVVGNPVAHSLSPFIHQRFAEQAAIQLTYDKILSDDSAFETIVSDFFNRQGKGLNITLPFKQRAYATADIKTERCLKAKAVNTLWLKDGLLHGDNTDGVGLIRDLTQYIDLKNKHVLIIGAGGAARGIIPALLDMQLAKLTITNRTYHKAEQLAVEFASAESVEFNSLARYQLIINATSASLDEQDLALPETVFEQQPFCYDLAYRIGQPTPFVTLGKRHGCQVYDGLGMLVEQAAEAFYIWHGFKPDTRPVLAFLNQSSKN
ncbi:shikimate dehydrogenase [Legionella dresdenensis]|uniref:Shikimate dehydrogenase (NADP(+)) n=1 Tax=Legionella dresdenensis TaxID=450200 RepID=A0ABV8CHD1_9GAMM